MCFIKKKNANTVPLSCSAAPSLEEEETPESNTCAAIITSCRRRTQHFLNKLASRLRNLLITLT